jgi:PilZ domain
MSGTLPNPNPGPGTSRRFPRYALDLRLAVHVFRPGTGASASVWGRSSELGEDGIGGTLTGELETGEVVSMEFSLPLTAYPMKVRALVRYRRGLHHGFEFLALSAEQRAVIRRVCEMLAAGE